jgi:hypothetical protein
MLQSGYGAGSNIDMNQIIDQVIARIPRTAGAVVYNVEPLEKLKKDFLETAKQKVLADISALSDDAKKSLKYLETRQTGVPTAEICVKAFLLPNGTGGYADKVNKSIRELVAIQVAFKDTHGKSFPKLKERIEELTAVHGASEQEIKAVKDHIIMEMLK